ADLEQRISVRLSTVSSDQRYSFRAQAATTTARNLGQVEAELEQLIRSGYCTTVVWPRRGEGERTAYNLTRLRPLWDHHPAAPNELHFLEAKLREGFVSPALKLAVWPSHRLIHRRAARPAAAQRARLRSHADLRTGDIVVHEDHGVARFAGFETKTVAGV